MTNRKLFAVIPAAGHSRRMGQPKLLLPVGKTTVIGRVISALKSAGIHDLAITVRRDDTALIGEIRRHGVEPIQPAIDPPDMRASIEHGLEWIEQTHHPTQDDAWLLLPADHPIIDAALIRPLCDAWSATATDVLVPTCHGRRGHPLIARWSTIKAVRALPSNVGVNQWLRDPATTVTEIAIDDPRILCDLDVPEDYARLLNEI
jgi:molybdenum cofactor cytidylyltransferase